MEKEEVGEGYSERKSRERKKSKSSG